MNSADVIGAGPTGRALKTLNNRNNLANLYLKKKLLQYEREKDYSVSYMDRHKFDTRDFLKTICRIESDTHPAARIYLGRDPTVTNFRVNVKRNKTAPLTLQHEFESKPKTSPLTTHEPLTTHVPEETPLCNVRTPNFNEARRSILLPAQTQTSVETYHTEETPSPKLTSPSKEDPLVLPSLDRKQSVYLQIATVVQNPDILSGTSDDSDEDSDAAPISPRRHKRMSKTRQSFMAWVKDKNIGSPVANAEPVRIKVRAGDPTEKRRKNFLMWLNAREQIKKNRMENERNQESVFYLPDNLPAPETTTLLDVTASSKPELGYHPSFSNVGQMIHPTKRPLSDRMKDFLGKVAHLKVEEDKQKVAPMSKDKKRRWKRLTQGLKAALADSSDDDDDDER